MPRFHTHTLTPRHLAVLQWFDKHAVSEDRPEGWCSEKRVQLGVRINNQRLAIGEALHDLTVKLNDKDDPFLLTHPSGKHYQLSDTGRKLARKCSVATRETDRGPVELVVETKTGRPPIIRSTDTVPQVSLDDDEDLLEDESPKARRDDEPTAPARQPAQRREPEPETEEDDADDFVTLMAPSAQDEINDEPATSRPPAAQPGKPAKPGKPAPAKSGKPAAAAR